MADQKLKPSGTASLRLPSYAKINLFLHITGRRADGFHNLQSWFQFIDLKDTLSFTCTNAHDSLRIKSNFNAVCASKDNLIYKAACAVKPFAKKLTGVNVALDKQIPTGAGLGGGSSNAATTLIGLNQLWACNLNQAQLIDIGKHIGADVPIFLFQKAAWAEGIGEKLTEKSYIEQSALIIKPDFHAATSRLFQHPKLKRNREKRLCHTTFNLNGLENDFLPVIEELYPEILQHFANLPDKNQLRLTGTGACFYLLSPDINTLRQNQKNLAKGVDSWIVNTLNFASVNS